MENDVEEITNYLSYLRDVSRKLVYRAGFEFILPKKRKDKVPYNVLNTVLRVKNPEDSWNNQETLTRYLRYIERYDDEKMFLGLGLFAGKKNKRLFSAPLMILQCEMNCDDNGFVSLNPEVDSLSLNYDFISTLMPSSLLALNQEEDREEEVNALLNLPGETLVKIREAEGVVSEFSKRNFEEWKDEMEDFTRHVFNILCDIDGFRQLKCVKSAEYDFDREYFLYKNSGERNSIFEGILVFIEANHFFAHRVPDQLSTYKALNKFVSSISENGQLNNNSLQTLLVNGLTSGRKEIGYDAGMYEKATEALRHIPLSLSGRQKLAVKNAWSKEISYIQGPPGTGKSHTIIALILSGAILDKKVLVVSQKRPALAVIKDKIGGYLSEDEVYDGVVHYNGDHYTRRHIRNYCKSLLDVCGNKNEYMRDLQDVRSDCERYGAELSSKMTELENARIVLTEELERESAYYGKNKEFEEKRKRFEKRYSVIDLPVEFKSVRIRNPEKYRRVLCIIERICQKRPTLLTELYVFKFKKHLVEKFGMRNEYFIGTDFYYFCKDFVELSILYSEVCRLRGVLTRESWVIREHIDSLCEEIANIERRYIRAKYKCHVYELIGKNDYRAEINDFSSMIFYADANIINNKMSRIDFGKIVDVLPFWTAEIRHLGKVLPMRAGLFDLVVVDEASQVNLAEILPVFYLGKNICIAGDHKQLSLNATGLSFSLSSEFDKLTWSRYNSMSYEKAEDKRLTVSKSSILDFIRSDKNNMHVPEVMLDEHYRSLPHLANYTSSYYRDESNPNGLKVMTETPDKSNLNCFKAIRVNGVRKGKVIKDEVNTVLILIKKLIGVDAPDLFDDFIFPDHIGRDHFSLGVISLIRDQCEAIKKEIEEQLEENLREKCNLMVGTPEEFQGNERDIMIFSLCLDLASRAKAFFSNSARLNVATSRAKSFTYVVYSEFPDGYVQIKNYFKEMGVSLEEGLNPVEVERDLILKPFDAKFLESDFESRVYDCLNEYVCSRNSPEVLPLSIHNQVSTCGEKRLDFVIYNPNTKKSIAVEVDGKYHFSGSGRQNTDIHFERMELLMRAGWQIVNTPYYKWYCNGWLSDRDHLPLRNEIDRIYDEIDKRIM
jgi:hypothetical protein